MIPEVETMSIPNAIPCEHCGAPRGSDCEPTCPEGGTGYITGAELLAQIDERIRTHGPIMS